MIDRTELWIVIIGLGLGSFGLRFAFLGLVGDRPIPAWLMRHLRYPAVSVLPALIMPLIVFPAANDGQPEPVRLTAAVVALGVGFYFKNPLLAMVMGGLTLVGGLYWFA